MNALHELHDLFDQIDLYDLQNEFWRSNWDQFIKQTHQQYLSESKRLSETAWNEIHDEANLGNLKTFSNFVYEIFLDYFEGLKERGF